MNIGSCRIFRCAEKNYLKNFFFNLFILNSFFLLSVLSEVYRFKKKKKGVGKMKRIDFKVELVYRETTEEA